MNIFIDESGSFVNADNGGAWNCVVAYMSPEGDRRRLREALNRFKRKSGASILNEVKLGGADEGVYFDLLAELARLKGVFFAVATDAGMNTIQDVRDHQIAQAEKIVEHKEKMHYEAARQGLEGFAEQVRNIAPQLYVQLLCQVQLIAKVVNYGLLYFVQRTPNVLGTLRWRIDQKNSSKNVYQESYLLLTLPLLQSISLREPNVKLIGADYRKLDRFTFERGAEPTYLSDTYGIEVPDSDATALDLGKMLREDVQFADSKDVLGIQVADLIASGVRRCLRNNFNDSKTAARPLGRLTVRGKRDEESIKLVLFGGETGGVVDDYASDAVKAMTASGRAILS